MLKKIFPIFLSILGGFLLWLTLSWVSFLKTPLIPNTAAPLDYLFQPGSSITTMANDFVKQGMINRLDAYFFVALACLKGEERHLKAGEYRIMPGIKPAKLIDQMAKGEILYHRFTIIEGWTFKQTLDALNQNTYLTHTLNQNNVIEVMGKLNFPTQSPEGLFLPATYHFAAGTPDWALLKTAYESMQQNLTRLWKKRDPSISYKTPYQVLIVASLVEKETGTPSERPLVAGVIEQRLKKNMPLQIDSSVIYGMGKAYTGKISKTALKQDTPYNTYVHTGLPPTPIAMPSLASIEAVLHPKRDQWLYFVSKGDGSHIFSSDLKTQNKAVKLYQIKITYPLVGRSGARGCAKLWYASQWVKKFLIIPCQNNT